MQEDYKDEFKEIKEDLEEIKLDLKEEIKEDKKQLKEQKKFYRFNRQFLIGILIGLILTSIGFVGTWFYMQSKDFSVKDTETKTTTFINEKLMAGSGTKITSLKVAEGKKYYYDADITISEGNSIKAMISADGTRLCANPIEMVEPKKPETKKADKPTVELFVMSHCPYGTQIEKGIIPAIEALGDKIDFSLKFCNYAMHDEVELREQLSQYCIQKEQKDKLLPYLKCFLKAGKSVECVASTGIDKAKLSSCVASTDKEFSVISDFKTKKNYKGNFPGFAIFNDDNVKYGIEGSPSLVINGEVDKSAGRNSDSLLKSICAGFNNAPDACKNSLSTSDPSPGFGESSSAAPAASGAANAGCAQ